MIFSSDFSNVLCVYFTRSTLQLDGLVVEQAVGRETAITEPALQLLELLTS